MRMFTEDAAAIRARAEQVLAGLEDTLVHRYTVTVEATDAQAGSGSLPLEKLPSFALALKPTDGSVEELARHLRTGVPAVVGYIRKDKLLLDLRTVLDEDVPELVARLNALA